MNNREQNFIDAFAYHLKLLMKSGHYLNVLSRKTGITRKSLYRMIKGEVNPTLLTLRKLASATDLPLSKFLDFDYDESIVYKNLKVRRDPVEPKSRPTYVPHPPSFDQQP